VSCPRCVAGDVFRSCPLWLPKPHAHAVEDSIEHNSKRFDQMNLRDAQSPEILVVKYALRMICVFVPSSPRSQTSVFAIGGGSNELPAHPQRGLQTRVPARERGEGCGVRACVRVCVRVCVCECVCVCVCGRVTERERERERERASERESLSSAPHSHRTPPTARAGELLRRAAVGRCDERR
jgi:hypothetical protein